ncbi:MAG: HAMP domain-containing histidine kinase [Oscillospiraceae bacterium]|nr:HAMP domain-containing histidine kinase [Oscillospiraceae bacterium]
MRRAQPQGESRFPKSVFWIVLGVLLGTSGISTGIVVGMNQAEWLPIIQVHIMVFYWIGVALLLTWLIRARMKAVYDAPMQAISDATKRVSRGDFTVRIDPLHEEGKEDYLDLMIHDLNTMIAELGSIETLKTDFISNVSHEIKTPIAVIQNYAQLLQSDALTEQQRREYPETIYDAATRLNTLISNILKLSRLENQQVGLSTQTFDLSGQVAECLLGFEPVWEEKQIEIVPAIEDGVTVDSDRELLSIVWNNLLSNAFKFTEPGGTVGVSLKNEGGCAVISVRDTGCGMTEETVRHIFDKFYQGDTSHATRGNGLGLALVKRILDMTGGEVRVMSAPGEGSTFTVTLRTQA